MNAITGQVTGFNMPASIPTRILEQKLTEAKSKKDTLKARAKSAQTSRQINDMIQGLNTSNAMVAFDRMEEKVMSLEAESEATLQVTSYYRSMLSRFLSKGLEGGYKGS